MFKTIMALPSLTPVSPRKAPKLLPNSEEGPEYMFFHHRKMSLADSIKLSDFRRHSAVQSPMLSFRTGSCEKFFQTSDDARCAPMYPPRQSFSIRSSLAMKSARKQIPVPFTLARFAFKTEVGMKRGKPNPQNQDRGFYQFRGDYYLIGVCDGHGPSGHLISGFISTHFPQYVSHLMSSESTASIGSDVVVLTSAYNKLVDRLRKADINCEESGSTCVSVLIRNNTITCGNVGNSRAVLGRLRNGVWTALSLSQDHQPSDTIEYARIVTAGGQIAESQRPGSRTRIYLRNKNYPGIHISRSIGDTVASLAGVTSDPDLKSLNFTSEDKFVVLATDGVWGVMECQEVVEMLGKYWKSGNADGGCDRIKSEARLRWTKLGKTIDDVTVMVGFFGMKRV